MRRLYAKLVIFLLLIVGGAIINVAVAWAVANLIEERIDVTRTIERPGEAPVVTKHNWPIDDIQGWPLRSLADQLPPHEYPAAVTVIEVTNAKFAYGPLWPGFAINTIFYAAMLWMLFAVPVAVRRRIGGVRIKRGQCAACGYSLSGSAGNICPECGTAV